MAGLAAAVFLPVAQYPEITPPTVQVSCQYTGASARVVADTVAAPIEQQVNGVEDMLYMSSQSTNDGGYNLTVTFKLGTSLDMAQVLVQNRVSQAMPMLPDVVKATGVTVKKRSPSILLVVNLYSDINPETKKPYYDQLYLSNYATIQIRDELARIEGVGDVNLLGQQDYSMRVWLDPNRLAARNLTAADIVAALKEQNVQVAAGQLGQPPVPGGVDFQYTMTTLGRLTEPEQFGDIVVKTGEGGESHPLERRRPHRAGRQEPGHPLHARRQAQRGPGHLSASRHQCAGHGRPHSRQDEGAVGQLSARGSSTRSSTTRRRSSRSRCARCSRRCATP